VLVLAIAGLAVGLMQRRFLASMALIVLFVCHFLFHLAEVNRNYIGLARFHLFLFAPLAMLAIWFLGWLAGKSRTALLAACIVCLAVNIAISPIAITGEKKPGWASPNATRHVDLYFPFEDTINWLKTNRPNWPILIGGCYFSSPLTWYCSKAGYRPQIALAKAHGRKSYIENLKNTIATARKGGFPLVVYHKMQGGLILSDEEKSILGYKPAQIIKNRYLAMVIYQAELLPRQRDIIK